MEISGLKDYLRKSELKPDKLMQFLLMLHETGDKSQMTMEATDINTWEKKWRRGRIYDLP